MWDLLRPGIEPVSPALAGLPWWPYPLDHQGRPSSYILKPNLPIVYFPLGAHCLSSGFSVPHAGGPLGSHHMDLPLVCSGHTAQILTPELLPQRQEASFLKQPRPHPLRQGPGSQQLPRMHASCSSENWAPFPPFPPAASDPGSQTFQPELISCQRTQFSGAGFSALKGGAGFHPWVNQTDHISSMARESLVSSGAQQ